MKQCLKLEFYRCFHRANIYIALFISCLIPVLYMVTFELERSNYIAEIKGIEYPFSFFNSSMIFYAPPFWRNVFYYSLLVLIVLSHAGSFYSDKKSGYMSQICIRRDKKTYFWSKYITVFVSAAIVCGAGILTDYFLSSAIFPMLPPQRATAMFMVSNGSLSELFYAHPVVYMIVMLIADMLHAGALACLSLAVTHADLSGGFIIELFPFIVVMIVQAIGDLTGLERFIGIIQSMNIGEPKEFGIWLIELLILIIVGMRCFLRKCEKRDVLE